MKSSDYLKTVRQYNDHFDQDLFRYEKSNEVVTITVRQKDLWRTIHYINSMLNVLRDNESHLHLILKEQSDAIDILLLFTEGTDEDLQNLKPIQFELDLLKTQYWQLSAFIDQGFKTIEIIENCLKLRKQLLAMKRKRTRTSAFTSRFLPINVLKQQLNTNKVHVQHLHSLLPDSGNIKSLTKGD